MLTGGSLECLLSVTPKVRSADTEISPSIPVWLSEPSYDLSEPFVRLAPRVAFPEAFEAEGTK